MKRYDPVLLTYNRAALFIVDSFDGSNICMKASPVTNIV